MKIDLIVVHIHRYRKGHEIHFVPPITGIHLAALTPPGHTVRVIHQQVEKVHLDSDADVIALSFFSGFAPEAYRLAGEYRRRGKIVIAGGPHVTFAPDGDGFGDGVYTMHMYGPDPDTLFATVDSWLKAPPLTKGARSKEGAINRNPHAIDPFPFWFAPVPDPPVLDRNPPTCDK